MTTSFEELSVYSVNVPCHCCDLDFTLTQYKEGLQKPRQYSNQELVWERCWFSLSALDHKHLLNETSNLKECQHIIFSRCGTHLHPAMESTDNNSCLLGADGGSHMEWCAAISGGEIRVDISKDMYVLAYCSCAS